MEAIERVSGETVPVGAEVRQGSFERLRASGIGPVLDPEDCELPFRGTYDKTRVYSWMAGFDLLRSERVWAPVDLVVSPGTEGLYPGAHTNGLASGNTYTEATLHALCEVVERDAIAQHEFHDDFGDAGDKDPLPVRMIDPNTLPREAQDWRDRLVRAGLRFYLGELVNECAVPTYAVGIVDPAYPSPDGPIESRFDGWGADVEPRRAVLRAITEAVQSRAIMMQGARDTFEGGQKVEERPWTLRRLVEFYYPDELCPFDGAASASSGDLLIDLKDVCRKVERAGFDRAIVFDLTRLDLAVPVVRVLVPGMSGPQRYGKRPSWRQLRRLL
jgi:ribosomal protein S12 methylthiotransferase accessory factor